MTRTSRRTTASLAAALALTLAAAAPPSGGWAVVSVFDPPHAWVVGRPLELRWETRQHAVTPLGGLEPRIEARSGWRVVRGRTSRFIERGRPGYRGALVLPSAGDWQITIESGFMRSRAVLLPMPVLDTVTEMRGTVAAHLASLGVAPASAWEAGRRTFAARGCVTCHDHALAGTGGELASFGGDLSSRRFPAGYLASFLKDPSVRAGRDGRRMPDLELREDEIARLVAFLHGEERRAVR